MCPYREEQRIIIIGTCECDFKGKPEGVLHVNVLLKPITGDINGTCECVLKEIHLKCECVFNVWKDLNVL